jgi:hypothetical protein
MEMSGIPRPVTLVLSPVGDANFLLLGYCALPANPAMLTPIKNVIMRVTKAMTRMGKTAIKIALAAENSWLTCTALM